MGFRLDEISEIYSTHKFSRRYLRNSNEAKKKRKPKPKIEQNWSAVVDETNKTEVVDRNLA